MAPLLLWALVRTLGLERGYPAVPLLAFTPYVALLAPLAVAWSLLLWRRGAALAALAAALALGLAVLPRGFASEPDQSSGPTLRVMSVNLLVGSAELDQVAALVESQRVELLSVQELTDEAADAIAASPIAEQLPFSITDPEPAPWGSGLYSATRPSAPEKTLVAGVPAVRMRLRALAGEQLAVYPPPPTGPAQVSTLGRYLKALPSATAGEDKPILIGDFNATLDHATPRDLLERGFADAGEQLGRGLTPTWTSDGPFGLLPPPVAIDHVIYDERLRAVDYEVFSIDGSDHRAVLATLAPPGVRP